MLSQQAVAIGAPSEFWITQWKLGSSENQVIRRAGLQEVKQHLCGRKKRFSKKTNSSTNETKSVEPSVKSSPQISSSIKKSSSLNSVGVEKRKRSAGNNDDKNGLPACKKSSIVINNQESSDQFFYPILNEPSLPSQQLLPSSYQYPIPSQVSNFSYHSAPRYPRNIGMSGYEELFYHQNNQPLIQQKNTYPYMSATSFADSRRQYVVSPQSFSSEEDEIFGSYGTNNNSTSPVNQSPFQDQFEQCVSSEEEAYVQLDAWDPNELENIPLEFFKNDEISF